NIEIEFTFIPIDQYPYRVARRLLFTVQRPSLTCSARITMPDGVIQPPTSSNISNDGKLLTFDGMPTITIDGFFELMYTLANTLYIGPFRNAVNVGTKDDYFDIKTGQALIQQWRQLQSGRNKQQRAAIIA